MSPFNAKLIPDGSAIAPFLARRVNSKSPFPRGSLSNPYRARRVLRNAVEETIAQGSVLATHNHINLHFYFNDRSDEMKKKISASVKKSLIKMGSFIRRTARQQIKRRNAGKRSQIKRILNKSIDPAARVAMAKAMANRVQDKGTSKGGRPPFAHQPGGTGLKAIKFANYESGKHVDVMYVPFVDRRAKAGPPLEQTNFRGDRLSNKTEITGRATGMLSYVQLRGWHPFHRKQEHRSIFYPKGKPLTVHKMRPNLKIALRRNIPKIRQEFGKIARRYG